MSGFLFFLIAILFVSARLGENRLLDSVGWETCFSRVSRRFWECLIGAIGEYQLTLLFSRTLPQKQGKKKKIQGVLSTEVYIFGLFCL